MKPTTIMLPQDLKMIALKKAQRIGVSLAEFIRQSIRAAIQEPSAVADPFFNDTRVFTGKAPKDGAKDHDKYLYGDNI